MKTITYNKLVRDKIPEIIEKDGKECVYEILDEESYMNMLNKKLREELCEYEESQDIEELADLYQVMEDIVKAKGYSIRDFQEIVCNKKESRGGFEKRILLKEVRG